MHASSFKDGGILNIHKPSGPSSFHIVQIVRSKLNEKRVGHCGTLDPLASGVLLVLFGKATSFSDDLMECDKVYRCVINLGIKTDTGDLGGKVVQTADFIPPNETQIASVLAQFKGPIQQCTPSFSAAKYKGRKLYEYARKQIETPVIKRNVVIHSLHMIKHKSPFIELRVCCSKGTYIRQLAVDIGNALGIPATCASLVREKVGPFSLEEGISWDKLETMGRDELIQNVVCLK